MTEWPNWTELITNEAFHLCLKVWNASIRISHVNNAKHVNKGPYPIHTHTYKPQLLFVPCRGNRDQKVNISWIIENAREFQKNIYFCFIDYAKAFDSVNHNKLWKILQEIGIPDHLTCFLRNLYARQEATVRTRHGTVDWFQIGRGVHQGWVFSFFMLIPSFENMVFLCSILSLILIG